MASTSGLRLSSQKKQKQLGKYCLAGDPGKASCNNNSLCAGISMHLFPKCNEKLRNVWIKFVQKHRHDWQTSAYSALCLAHFESHCFTQRLDIGLKIGNGAKSKRWLNKEAFPTIDTVVPSQTTPETTDRERRQILRDTLRPDVPSSSKTVLTASTNDIASETLCGDLPDSDSTVTPTTPEGRLKDLDVFKERLRNSKEEL